jgi:hypothetical protein
MPISSVALVSKMNNRESVDAYSILNERLFVQ